MELDRASLYRYPGNYMRYLELKADRLAAEDAETNRARTKLRRESEWMAKQPRARQAKSKARQDQFYELVPDYVLFFLMPLFSYLFYGYCDGRSRKRREEMRMRRRSSS